MADFKTPGVFVDEIPTGAHAIKGVPTSTAAFLGETERGGSTPRLITSDNDYLHWFGSTVGPGQFMPDAVKGFFENGGRRLYICPITGGAAKPAEAAFGQFAVRAIGSGNWGNRVWARIEDGTNAGFRLRLAYWAGNTEPFDPFTADGSPATPRPALIEDFDNLTLDESSPDYVGKRVPFIDLGQDNTIRGADSSALAILVRQSGDVASARPENGSQRLSGGTDDNRELTPEDYRGEPNTNRTEAQGLAALGSKLYDEVALLYAPNASNEIAGEIIAHCERLRSRFAVIDCPPGQSDAGAFDARAAVSNSSYAACYYPWIATAGVAGGAPRIIPPGGHCIGLYARVDSERGVFKAPANEALRGALDLEFDVSDQTQEKLRSRGVNAIRSFTGRGVLVWGARTLSSDAQWQYISIRRFLIFLERSITEGTQWVVFEPNDASLWAQVTDSIQLFLLAQWRSGALMGETAKDAFFVRCNQTTMTQDDIQNGRLICEIGVAPVRPAEFVILRIFQSTAKAKT